MSSALLEVRGLAKQFGGITAIRSVDLNIAQGSVHAIIGPNGAGKTTVFNCIAAYLAPSAGLILLDGKRIDGLPAHRVARHGVARTYQNVRLFASMSALENVLVGQHLHLHASLVSIVLGLRGSREEERQAREQAQSLLTFVGLGERAEHLASALPYGDQRRLEIARALATRPRLLLLDEPAAGMNPAEGVALVRLIERIRTELGITVLLIEHHMRVVMAVAERISVFERGAVLAEGTPAEIRADERVIAAYLGSRAAAVKPLSAQSPMRVQA